MRDEPGGTDAGAGSSRRSATLLFLGILGVQVVVPALRLGSDTTSRFGWQMFSTVRIQPTFGVRFEDGRLDTLEIGDFVAKPRSDIDLASLLPPHLCLRLDRAVAVLVTRPGSEGSRSEYVCPGG